MGDDTLLGILADFNRAVVWIFSILPLISISSSLVSRFLVTVPNVPTTISITVTFNVPDPFQLTGKVPVFL